MKASNEKNNNFSLPQTLVKKYLNIKRKCNEFYANDIPKGYKKRGREEAFVDKGGVFLIRTHIPFKKTRYKNSSRRLLRK